MAAEPLPSWRNERSTSVGAGSARPSQNLWKTVRDVGKSLAHRPSTEIVDAAKHSPAAFTAGNAEEGDIEWEE